MKTVFPNADLCHAWANQTQSEGKNSNGSIFFRNKTIYSYGSHFPIAKHAVSADGKDIILFTERRYSNTTAKHISKVHRACRNDEIIYCYNPESLPADNFHQWALSAEIIAGNLVKARKPEIYIQQINEIGFSAKKYADCMGVQIPEELANALSITDAEKYKNYIAVKSAAEEKRKAEKDRRLKAEQKKATAKWLKGDGCYLSGQYDYDLLRIKDDVVQTTQQVSIPIPVAKRLYATIKNGDLKVGSQFLDFPVKETGKVTVIGCHKFKTEYLLKFGESL